MEEFRTLPSAFSALLSILQGKIAFFQSLLKASPILGATYVFGYGAGIYIGQSFLCALILYSYRIVHSKIYHSATEPQDYEMVDFLVKRFKLWIGLSKTKEVKGTYKCLLQSQCKRCEKDGGGEKCNHSQQL